MAPKSYIKLVELLMYILDILNDVIFLGLLLVHVNTMNTNMICSHSLSFFWFDFLLREVSSMDYSVLIISGYFT